MDDFKKQVAADDPKEEAKKAALGKANNADDDQIEGLPSADSSDDYDVNQRSDGTEQLDGS